MARKAELFLAKVAKKDRSQNKQGHGSQTLVAKVAKKTWLWPCLPGFTRPHFPGKPGQKPGKPGLEEFGQAPDARDEEVGIISSDSYYFFLQLLQLMRTVTYESSRT